MTAWVRFINSELLIWAWTSSNKKDRIVKVKAKESDKIDFEQILSVLQTCQLLSWNSWPEKNLRSSIQMKDSPLKRDELVEIFGRKQKFGFNPIKSFVSKKTKVVLKF